MKKLIYSILIFASTNSFAQSIKIKIPAQSIKVNVMVDSNGNFKALPKEKEKATRKTYEDEDGKLHPVWETANGKFFIFKESPKTKKQYKYYLKF